MRKTILLVGMLTLGACTTIPGLTRGTGTTVASFEKAKDGSFKGKIEDAKDRGNSNLDMTLADGTSVHFSSEGVDASGPLEAVGKTNAENTGKLLEVTGDLLKATREVAP